MKYILILCLLVLNYGKTFGQLKRHSLFDYEQIEKNGVPASLNEKIIFEDNLKLSYRICQYKNGKRHGQFLYFNKGKFLCEKNYKNNVLDGYFSCGEEAGFYKNGKKSGFWEYSDDTGNYRKVNYNNDKKNGYFLSVDSYSKIEGYYKNDKEDGIWTTYDEKGEILTKVKYKNGRIIETLKDARIRINSEISEPKKEKK